MKKISYILFGFALASTLSAQTVLVNEDFAPDGSESASDNLAGTVPNTSATGNPWKTPGPFKPSVAGALTSDDGVADVAIPTLTANTTYELSLTFDQPFSASGGTFPPWVAVGFFNGGPLDKTMPDNSSQSAAWTLVRENGDTRALEGPNTQNEAQANSSTGVAMGSNVQLLSRLTVGSTLTDTTWDAFVTGSDGVQTLFDLDSGSASTSLTGFDVSNIDHIGFDTTNPNAVVREFNFVAVPEPAHIALLIGAFAILFAHCRRMRG